MNLINASNFEGATADRGFRTSFPNSKVEMVDSFNKAEESYVKFKMSPVAGEEQPFTTILSTGVIASDPKYKDFFKKDGKSYVVKANVNCLGSKNGLVFSMS